MFSTLIKASIDINTKSSEINTEKAFFLEKNNSNFERRYILEEVEKNVLSIMKVNKGTLN